MRAWHAATSRRRQAGGCEPAHSCVRGARSPFLVGLFEGFRLQFATALEQNLDLLLGRLQGALAVAREGHAALEQLERLIQWQVAALESLHEGFQFGQGLFEVGTLLLRAKVVQSCSRGGAKGAQRYTARCTRVNARLTSLILGHTFS